MATFLWEGLPLYLTPFRNENRHLLTLLRYPPTPRCTFSASPTVPLWALPGFFIRSSLSVPLSGHPPCSHMRVLLCSWSTLKFSFAPGHKPDGLMFTSKCSLTPPIDFPNPKLIYPVFPEFLALRCFSTRSSGKLANSGTTPLPTWVSLGLLGPCLPSF